MNKILLTTLFSGYNYGSSLQTFATKSIIEELGCECELVARKSIVKGRDIRLGKLFTILWRTLLTVDTKTLKAYKSSYQKTLIGDSVKRFTEFEEKYLQPERMGWSELQKEAKDSVACIAGSDQLWDPTTLYVDPMYYLRFAPRDKRISFATSMGHDFVAKYNEKKLRKWISEVKHLSVREDSGVKLIKELCGRDALHLLDPTLLLNGETWRKKLEIQEKKNKYILAYFLDAPSQQAKCCINNLKKKYQCDVIAIPYEHEDMSYATKVVPTGPLEFLSLVDNAVAVVTDSFHGTAFSINLHTPFFVFDRNYGTAHSQSSRVISLLKKVGLIERYEPSEEANTEINLDFTHSDKILTAEREIAKRFLQESVMSCRKK